MIHRVSLYNIHQMPMLISALDKHTFYGSLKNNELCIY